MEHVTRYALVTAVFTALCLIAGLVKPHYLLWWEDIQSRRKVLKLYGSILVFAILMYLISSIV